MRHCSGSLLFPDRSYSGDARFGSSRMFPLSSHWQLHGTFPLILGGGLEWAYWNDHGGDDEHIEQFTSSSPTIPKGFVFARTFTNADLYLADSFHSLVRRRAWRHNSGTWYENDVVWAHSKAHRSVKKIRCKHASFSDRVVKQYSIDALFSNGSSRTLIRRKKLFEMNARRVGEGLIHQNAGRSCGQICWSSPATGSNGAINGVEQNNTRFFTTPGGSWQQTARSIQSLTSPQVGESL